MTRTILLIFILLYNNHLFSQQNQEPNFRSPLDIPLLLSGTFGELRTNHFHAGLDFKTQGKSGLKIYAIEDGYISRIKVSPWGYGKAIYITHNNGYTSVYAHLMKYHGAIQDYVFQQQYIKQSYDIELFPDQNQFLVKKGDIIGLSGNTGSSFAPHLHFEIRHSYNQNPVNALQFDFDIIDNIPPIIKEIKIYPKSKYTFINGENRELTLKVDGIHGNYFIEEPIKVTGPYALSIQTYDVLNGANNKNGVYSIDLFVDSTLVYSHEIEEFAFKETRYINCHLDYFEKIENNKKFHRCYTLPNNRLSIYNYVKNEGIIKIDKNQIIEFFVDDVYGNSSYLNLNIIEDTASVTRNSQQEIYTEVFPFQIENSYENEFLSINIPVNSLYDTLYFVYNINMDTNSIYHAPIHTIHYESTPLHFAYLLKLKSTVSEKLAKKAFICKINEKGKSNYIGGTYDKGYITTKTKYFGQYSVSVDTIAPIIKGLNIYPSKTMNSSTLKMTIRDNESGIKSFNGYINNEWILMEYEPKSNRLTHFFDKSLKKGKNNFRLIVEDQLGNISEYKADFYR
ncbi:MAG: M23 family metallopeptidase [Flavobacteriales bacterium]